MNLKELESRALGEAVVSALIALIFLGGAALLAVWCDAFSAPLPLLVAVVACLFRAYHFHALALDYRKERTR